MADEGNLTEEDLEVSIETDEDVDIEDTGEEDDTAPTPGEDDDTSTDVAAKLAELEDSNRGLVKSLTAQRGIRQDLQGQLDGIKEALDQFKTNAENNTGTVDDVGTSIPINFDDEGNPFLDPANLPTTQNADIQALQQEINALRATTNATAIETNERAALNNLLGEKEGYTKAHEEVTKAWTYLKDDIFDAYLVEKGIQAPKTADQAIDIAMGSKKIGEQFTKKFPTLNMESVLEAHLIATPRYLRKALDLALVDASSSHESLDLTKPTSLAAANSSGGDSAESLLSRVANMSNDEFGALDTKTMEKIDRLLAQAG